MMTSVEEETGRLEVEEERARAGGSGFEEDDKDKSLRKCEDELGVAKNP